MERVAPIIDSHPSTAAIKERGLTGRCERILRMDCHRAAKQNAVDRSLWIWRSQRSDPRRCLCQVKSITGSDAIRDWPVLTASSLFERRAFLDVDFDRPLNVIIPRRLSAGNFFSGRSKFRPKATNALSVAHSNRFVSTTTRIACIFKPSSPPPLGRRDGLRDA